MEKITKTKIAFSLFACTAVAYVLLTIMVLPIIGIQKAIAFIKNPLGEIAYASVNVKSVKKDKVYAYNEQVPEDVILEELYSLADRFNLIGENWEKLIRCEATCDKYNHKDHGCEKGKLDNLARNPKSTAVGLGQYLIRTWYGTDSWKKLSIARTDYKATLFEMALDLSNGEQDKWSECLEIKGLYNFKK